ncbi:phosphopentomutase [Pelagibaculum spongiae]|uniref:Phosphopentomutase n=1 Tax=Pelagibaculum spongiae TaxID=2080658 RepID=A0A2V1GRU9_9GAMM|nr:phosphopentomutase [Pelagibaculum spongiae]PVZ63527.1 phosphopentomutase [Pelagibaculum spongiae]
MKRTVILMMDSLGIGSAPDAEKFGDVGANTLGHIAKQCENGEAGRGLMNVPNLSKLGLGHANAEATGIFPAGFDKDAEIIGAYGHAAEISSGKDTPSGHWEMAGVPVLFEWGYFSDLENSFPQELLDAIVEKAGLPGYLGNCHSSGTVILDALGEAHMKTGKPIFYTSADSVFQIACHEETYGLDNLLELCKTVRELLADYNIGRVIARPFVGSAKGDFQRTGNRHDYSIKPPATTVLEKLADSGGEVVSVGKIADIYAHCGITKKLKGTGLEQLWDVTLQAVKDAGDQTMVFTNFVDFDSSYGHRRDVKGYADAIEYFDTRLPELFEILNEDDLVIITADHGCDPTWPGSDHTREFVPVIAYGKSVEAGSLGKRDTFADIGQSIAEYFSIEKMEYGTSFLRC